MLLEGTQRGASRKKKAGAGAVSGRKIATSRVESQAAAPIRQRFFHAEGEGTFKALGASTRVLAGNP